MVRSQLDAQNCNLSIRRGHNFFTIRNETRPLQGQYPDWIFYFTPFIKNSQSGFESHTKALPALSPGHKIKKPFSFLFCARGETRTHTLFKAKDFKSFVSTISPPGQIKVLSRKRSQIIFSPPLKNFSDHASRPIFAKIGLRALRPFDSEKISHSDIFLRPRSESNRRIALLQRAALPLGY